MKLRYIKTLIVLSTGAVLMTSVSTAFAYVTVGIRFRAPVVPVVAPVMPVYVAAPVVMAAPPVPAVYVPAPMVYVAPPPAVAVTYRGGYWGPRRGVVVIH